MSGWYNGYTPEEREAKTAYRKRHRIALPPLPPRCDLCGNPRVPLRYHSEDYSQPYSWERGSAVFALCRACDGRLHKRFRDEPAWRELLQCVRAGWYAHEIAGLPKRVRAAARSGKRVEEPADGRPLRQLPSVAWWERLSTDPESLRAQWARVR